MLAMIDLAVAGEWRLVYFSGDVRVTGASQEWVRARPGQILNAGDSVWTGRSSRAQLATDDGNVILKQRSLVKIPSGKLRGGMTVLFLGQGEVTANVRRKERTYFSIQTPFLAAVVKGTEFTVAHSFDQSRLSVKSGVIKAIQTSTGRFLYVTAGNSVTASDATGMASTSEAAGTQASSHSGTIGIYGSQFFEGENLGNDDDPVPGGLARNGQNGDGTHCGGNCGGGQGNGGGNGTDNEGNGD